jgi:DNA-binding transcriptional ArsR family regulator
MSELLPSDAEVTAEQDGELQTLWLDSEEAGELLSSLASDTARCVLTTLHDEPATASEVADRVDTSLQNARHHLTNLQDSGLVRVADTRYSSKGREMNVYAPARDPMIVFVGNEQAESGLLDSLRGLLPVAAVLGVAALLVQTLLAAGADGPTSGMVRVGQDVGTSVADTALAPGFVFLAGGLFVLAALVVIRYTTT